MRPWHRRLGLGLLAIGLWGGWGAAGGQAQTVSVPPEQLVFQTLLTLPSIYDLGTPSGGNNGPVAEGNAWPTVTATEPSPVAQTLPSLWWNRDQIIRPWGAYRLVDDWVAFHSNTTVAGTGIDGLKVIDVRVDRQYWDALRDRTLRLDARQYSLLNQWGTTASSFGYHLRLFRAGRIVGIYSCDFSPHPAFTTPPVSEMPLDGLDSLNCFARVGPFVTPPPQSRIEEFAPP